MIPKEIFEQSIKRYFKPIQPYLEDPSVSEVMVNGPNDIWIEVSGKLQKTEARFETEDDLMSGAKNIAQYVGKILNELAKIKPAVGRCDQALAPTAESLARLEAKVEEISAQVETVRRTMAPGRPEGGGDEPEQQPVWQGTIAIPDVRSSAIIAVQLVTSSVDLADDYRNVLRGVASTVSFTRCPQWPGLLASLSGGLGTLCLGDGSSCRSSWPSTCPGSSPCTWGLRRPSPRPSAGG